MTRRPFWETKSLADMNAREWESLCDGCGLFCLVRFEDEDSGEIVPTHVACKLFDDHACRCKDYTNRRAFVPDCIKLTPHNIATLPWMPLSCALPNGLMPMSRCVAKGLPLPQNVNKPKEL